MQPIEILLTIAGGTGPVFEKARAVIGEDELALLIAKTALSETSLSLSPTRAAKVLGMSANGSRRKIDNTAVKNLTSGVIA